MDWFRFDMATPVPDTVRAALKEMAGCVVSRDGLRIFAGVNAAWLTMNALQHFQLHAKTVTSAAWLKEISPTQIQHIPEMRETVSGLEGNFPEYLLPWQRTLLTTYANYPSVHLWWPPGAAKSAAATSWGLLKPGRILFCTRSGARRTIVADIKRFTTASYFVLEGQSKQTIPDVRICVTGWDTLVHHVQTIGEWGPTTVIADECHRVKNFRRKMAIPRRRDNGEFVFKEDGTIVNDFVYRESMSAAARQVFSGPTVKRRLGATASPIKDRLRDLWAQLDLIEPEMWGHPYDWMRRYSGGKDGNYGGFDSSGRSPQIYVDELLKRLSFGVYQVPYSITHASLPPKRRQVTYLPREELMKDEGSEARLVLKGAEGESATLWMKAHARLAAAAARKKNAVAEVVFDSIGTNTKIVVITGLRQSCEQLHAAIEKKFATGRPKDVKPIQLWWGHGGTTHIMRDQIQQEFMAHPGPCVLVGTYQTWGECLPPDSLVLGENKRIDEYAKGDNVITASGLQTCRGMKRKAFDGELIEVRGTGTLPLKATGNHPVLCLSGRVTKGRNRHFEFTTTKPQWKPIEQIRPWTPSAKCPSSATGDFLLIPRHQGIFNVVDYDLERFVKEAHGARETRRARGAPTHVHVTSNVAWLLGLYVAEGSSSAVKRHPITKEPIAWAVTFSLGAHEQGLADRVQSVVCELGFSSSRRILPKTNGLLVTIKSTPLALLFRELFGTSSDTKKIPHTIQFHASCLVLESFLRGYTDGDGSRPKTKGTQHMGQASTASKVLALQLQLMFARLGRLACITPWKPTRNSSIRGRVVHSNLNYIVTWRWEDKHHKRHKVLEDFIAVPVVSTKRIPYKGDVIDIGTTDRTFLASNVVVHNSLNLQDTDIAIIAMLPPTPGEVEQLEGRFSRHGQQRKLLIRYLVAEGTYDEHVAQILIDKMPSVEKVIGDEGTALDGFRKAIGGVENEQALIDAVFAKVVSGDYEIDEDSR